MANTAHHTTAHTMPSPPVTAKVIFQSNITNSHASGAKGLEGGTSFQYDANGNLTVLDRGRRQSGGNNVAFFDYDVEGHIIGRADKATTLTDAGYFELFDQDPGAGVSADEYGAMQSFLSRIFNRQGGASTSTHLQSYIYANNKPIAEAAGDLQTLTRRLALVGGVQLLDDGGWELSWARDHRQSEDQRHRPALFDELHRRPAADDGVRPEPAHRQTSRDTDAVPADQRRLVQEGDARRGRPRARADRPRVRRQGVPRT